MLPLDVFKEVVKNSILFAIDLIIKNEKGEVLVGLRRNNPAKGYWFVPGGRVFKNELLKDALRRIMKDEVNLEIDTQAERIKMKGIYDHIYEENYFDEGGFNTHYVVVALECGVGGNDLLKSPQHEICKFMSINEICKSEDVHIYTKNYFVPSPANVFMSCGLE